ncbi:helix-turn-helix domain-containing protein [bacterium]|nr:helix-turn-helix domain-containing protein [bacterium]
MDQDQLREIIEKGESETVEFKENFDKEAIETTGAFANTKGGNIFIGVSDKGKMIGVQLRKETVNSWVNQIIQSTDPQIIPEIEVDAVDGKNVVIILIKEFPIKPVSVKGRCFRRVGTSNRMMTPSEISEMHLYSMRLSWDVFPVEGKSIKDIDMKKVRAYIRASHKTGRRKIADTPFEVLKKLEFVNEDKITWAALLIFGKEPQRPLLQSAVHCERFKKDKTVIIDDLMIETDLISQVDEVMKFIIRHLSVRYEFEGKPRRKEIWEYPLDALREAVVNAIVHRDYAAPSNVQVEIYDDHIQIWNPGRLLLGITVEDLYKKDHKSVIRNRLIAQVFYDIGYIEKYGSGTIKILDFCRQQGIPTPKFQEGFGGFSVMFRKDVYTEEYLHNLGLNERQIKAVMYVKERERITNREYQTLTTVSNKTAYLELSDLLGKDVFMVEGAGKKVSYTLKVMKK